MGRREMSWRAAKSDAKKQVKANHQLITALESSFTRDVSGWFEISSDGDSDTAVCSSAALVSVRSPEQLLART
jgi:hypothetical protein